MTKEELPAEIGKYTRLALIGEGGCARVFQAFDPELERWAALKLLSPRFSADATMREQFFTEIKVQAGLNIPGIVKVFDCGSSPHGLYYSMELVTGASLEKYCWDNHLTLRKKFSLLGEVAAIVDKLHRKGMLHRDLKPRNIMIDEYGQVKLLDLGLATMLEAEIKRPDNFRISGSPAYLPPEALRDKNVNSVTPAADLYSLAVTAYEIICGSLPYEVEFLSLPELFEVVNSETPKPMQTPFNEKIPRRAEKIILAGLSVNPAQRPSAAEFAKVMKDCSAAAGGILKPAARIAVAAIAAGIIYHLLASPGAETAIRKTAPDTGNAPPTIPEKTPVPVSGKITPPLPASGARTAPERKTFYRNSAPEDLRAEWRAVKNELAADSAFKGMGALYYSLPDKCLVCFRKNQTTIRSIDSRFESSGSLFREAGDVLTVELRKKSWDKPVLIFWMPVAGNADVLCPDDKIFNRKEGEKP